MPRVALHLWDAGASCDLASASAATPVVIGADGILCNLTKTLAAEQAKVSCIVKAGKDPHGMKLRPSERKQLANADLVLINGYSLTPALDSQDQHPWCLGWGNCRSQSSRQ